MTKTYAAAVVVLLGSACADPGAELGTAQAGGKADSFDGSAVTLVRAGTFFASSMYHAATVHYGFADAAAPGWAEAGAIAIAYDEHGANLPVVVDLANASGAYLGFVIQSTRAFHRDRWSHDQFVEVAAPAGQLVRLPVTNGAGYPFSPECYDVGVQNLDASQPTTHYAGFVTDVLYGFSPASRADYLADNDVPWFDLAGEPRANGDLAVGHEHDGDYKGSYVMLDELVWVPDGLNLVFKLGLKRYGGNCPFGDGDTVFLEQTSTQTYFRDLAP